MTRAEKPRIRRARYRKGYWACIGGLSCGSVGYGLTPVEAYQDYRRKARIAAKARLDAMPGELGRLIRQWSNA